MARFFLLFLLLTAGCSSAGKTRIVGAYDYVKKTEFSRLKSYRWGSVKGTKNVRPEGLRFCKEAVDRELKAKGLTAVSENPDCFVMIYAGKREKILVKQRNYEYYPSSFYWSGGELVSIRYGDGVLIIDVIDAKKKKLVWRGWARGAITPEWDEDERKQVITKAVKTVLAKFPPPRS